jgi:hypothetical protein
MNAERRQCSWVAGTARFALAGKDVIFDSTRTLCVSFAPSPTAARTARFHDMMETGG